MCIISPWLSMVAGFDRGNGKNEIRIWSGQAKNGCAFQALFVSACSIFSSLIGHFEDVSWKFIMKNWYSNRENAHDQSQEESLEALAEKAGRRVMRS